jgi:RNA polymerase sigma factor (sigma-70 family)
MLNLQERARAGGGHVAENVEPTMVPPRTNDEKVPPTFGESRDQVSPVTGDVGTTLLGAAATRRTQPDSPADPGDSPRARGPARRTDRGAERSRPSSARAVGVSDHALLGGFANGDATTGAAFLRRFQGRVFGTAINLLGDRGLAEDVAQEAFVRAWRHAATYDPERGSVGAWLLRITRNLAIDALRRSRPQPLDPEMVATLTPASPTASVEDATVTADLIAQARAALSHLPPGQAKALWLAAFYGYTARQIAVSEGIPVGTAKTRIRQGLRAVRAELTNPDAA